jgi:hypothetical protein
MQRTILAAAMLIALPGAAFAQSGTDVPGYPGVKVTPVDQSPPTAAVASSLRDQLSGNLTKAGYTDVKIMPKAFLIQAKNKAGEPVTMFLSPDSLTVFTAQDAAGQDSKAAVPAAPK